MTQYHIPERYADLLTQRNNMFTAENITRMIIWVINVVIAFVMMQFVNAEVGFEQAVIIGIVMIHADLAVIRYLVKQHKEEG